MSSTIPYTGNLRLSTESDISTDPFASEPEIHGKNIFVFDENPNIPFLANSLALEAKSLLNILQTTQRWPWHIREKFQIELRKINVHNDQCITYQMSLRIDPSRWFKYHVLNNDDLQDLEKLYEFGHCYYEKVKSETEQTFDIKNENEIRRLEFNQPLTDWCYKDQKGKRCKWKNNTSNPCRGQHYEWCSDENYRSTGKCTNSMSDQHNNDYCHFSNLQFKNPIIYQCRHESVSLRGRKVPCLFHGDPNLRIYANEIEKPSNYPYFIVSARPDATPVITLCPIKHCENEEYIQTSDAWQAVLKTIIYMKDQLKLDKLPLNRVHVNFGKWMSQKFEDPMRRNCHAHINIVLTRETIDKINDRNQSTDTNTWLFPSLVGSILPTVSYRFEDAWDLIKYMDGYMTPKWIARNRELEKRISILEAELKIIKQENREWKQPIFTPTNNGEEVDESPNIIDKSDIGKGINDTIVMQEYYTHKWDRYLFPWNRF